MTRLPALGPRGEGWVAAQVVVFVLVVVAGSFGPAWDGPARVVGGVLGAILIGGGAVLAVRGTLDLGSSLTPLPHPRDDASLIQTGVYARVRHPIYGGIVIASFGWGLLTASIPALVMALIAWAFFTVKSIARGGLARRALPRLPRVPGTHAAAHPLDRLSSRSRRSIESRKGSVRSAGSTSRIESFGP